MLVSLFSPGKRPGVRGRIIKKLHEVTYKQMLARKDIRLRPDATKVLLQFFYPGSYKRVKNIIDRITLLGEDKIEQLLDKVINDFSGRHRNFTKILENNYKQIEKFVSEEIAISARRKLLIGSYFSKEYSIESAALFNPSIVIHPGQSKSNGSSIKFILSLRATGEGHISSIVFGTGTITKDLEIKLDPDSRFVTSGQKVSSDADEDIFYEVKFDESTPLQERVLFPLSKYESHGMEDARFVHFRNDDGSFAYYSTYTGYDGRNISIQLLETNDFADFKVNKLQGLVVKDKGMALFPRKVNGLYTMISRQDGENLYIMQSDNIYEWNEAYLLREPMQSWEFVQLGNCGSPLETEEGWILLTHAVGPLRTYVMSALLLELDNPEKVKGYLPDPLISPSEEEREGYVPNVIYSCGSMIYNGQLIIPYAMSDSASSIAAMNVKDLLKSFIRI